MSHNISPSETWFQKKFRVKKYIFAPSRIMKAQNTFSFFGANKVCKKKAATVEAEFQCKNNIVAFKGTKS